MKDPKQERSQKQEKEGMLRLQGVRQPRSGAGPLRKNDGRTARNAGNELVEFKRTDNTESITLSRRALLDVEHNAIGEGRIGVLGFELAGRHYFVLTDYDYYERVRGPAEPSQTVRSGLPGNRAPHSDLGRSPKLGRSSKMLGQRSDWRQPVLRGIPGQRQDRAGQGDLHRRGLLGGQTLRRQDELPAVGLGSRRGLRSVGRGLGARSEKAEEEYPS